MSLLVASANSEHTFSALRRLKKQKKHHSVGLSEQLFIYVLSKSITDRLYTEDLLRSLLVPTNYAKHVWEIYMGRGISLTGHQLCLIIFLCVIKYGQTDGSSVQPNFPRSSSIKTN